MHAAHCIQSCMCASHSLLSSLDSLSVCLSIISLSAWALIHHGSSSKSVSGMFIIVTVTSRSQTRFTGIMCVYVLLFALYCLTCCISIHGQLEPVCLSMSPLQFLYRAIISVLQILVVLLDMYAICRCEPRCPAELGRHPACALLPLHVMGLRSGRFLA